MRIAARNEARFKIGDTVFKGCFRRVCSKESKGFTPGGWLEVKCVY